MHLVRRKTLAALILATLVGCGGSDSSSNDNSPSEESSFDAPTGELKTSMEKIEISDSANAPTFSCQAPEEATTVFETEDLIVSFGQKSQAPYYEQDLAYAAQMSQLGLDELISVTGLDKETDLNLNGTDKWFICFENSKLGEGTGYINGMRVNPKAFDNNALALTKHELFHTIQAELLQDNEAYSHLPFWFQEATAEYFAHAELQESESRSFLEEFTANIANVTSAADPADTSYDVLHYAQDQAIRTDVGYENKLYDIYVTSLKYLVDVGLDKGDMLNLIRNSHSNGSDYTREAFHSAMNDLEADSDIEIPTGYTYEDLRTVAGFTELVLNDWLADTEYSAGFTSVNETIEIGELFLINEDGISYTATVTQDQTTYYYTANSIPDGDYDIYAVDSDDENIYGPKSQTVTDGSLGDVDFTDQPVCTTGACSDED
ncbi:hypothetical protein [Vibrio hippocampi]|uniref:Uncharacterized protein n=1 Tax=Vibrio hippocampi TaxID=654686 RepID=A0ABM8ZG82_9VIBR|nr:hypothetical protein [Vibrio hippocampi]CAH0525477.1 hypothetical protein VHP8226_01000 [Vibrio hippocampi]